MPAAPTVVVRPATPDDVAAIVEVQVASWRAAYATIVPAPFLRAMSSAERSGRVAAALREPAPRSEFLVAADGDSVVGFVRVGQARDDDVDPARVGEIYALYVVSDYWGRGVGRRLTEDGLDVLRAEGFDSALLWVLEDNARARRFYECAGFRPDGSRKVLDLGAPVPEVRYHRGAL